MQMAFGLCWSTFLLLPKYLTTELDATASQIGFVSAIPTFAGTLAVPIVGRRMRRRIEERECPLLRKGRP